MNTAKRDDPTRVTSGANSTPEVTSLSKTATASLLKSVLHNVGVVLVGFGVAYIGTRLDLLIGWRQFHSAIATAAGWVLLDAGFLLRVWAAFDFYERKMKVISLEPQRRLVTTGPYRFTRNPLYLGGNVFIFFGAALLFGSPGALLIIAAHLPFVDLFIRREERQLAKAFGDEWIEYKKHVRRWI
ncbi:MAG: methyltransferase family protein [Candidatus Acidiferrales bacterium]